VKRRMTTARIRAIRALEREMEPVFDDFYREIRDLEIERPDPHAETVANRDLVAVGK
jgi:hypothetical protein